MLIFSLSFAELKLDKLLSLETTSFLNWLRSKTNVSNCKRLNVPVCLLKLCVDPLFKRREFEFFLVITCQFFAMCVSVVSGEICSSIKISVNSPLLPLSPKKNVNLFWYEINWSGFII